MILDVFSRPILGLPSVVDKEGNPREDVLIFDDILVCHTTLVGKIIDTVIEMIEEAGLEYEDCVPWRPSCTRQQTQIQD